MPDLFDPLKGAPDPLVRPALPAEEVRRRGEIMRRRRTAAKAGGAVLAVVLVVSGGVVLGGGLTTGSGPSPQPPATQAPTGTPEPAPGPEVAWLTRIPAGFPLAEDLPQPRSDEEGLAGPSRDVRVFDMPFEACGQAAGLGTPVDTLAVRHTQPEWFDGRALQVYDDEASARTVLEKLVRLYDDCPEHVFEGPPDTIAAATVRPVPHGEEGYLVTRTFSTDGLRTTGLELLHVVRVGNTLLVSNLSNEGGADDLAVARQLDERDPVIEAVAAAMCVFSADGCDDGTEDPSAALEGALLRTQDVRELTAGLRTTWGRPHDGDDTPLGCWTEPVDGLEPVAWRLRSWQGSAPSRGFINASATTVVVELGSDTAARRAYDRVVDGLSACDDRETDEHEPVRRTTPSGPAVSRVVTGPAPEVCTECDTGWIDVQAVALVRTRLVLLSMASIGDLQLVPEEPMPDAITLAARRAWAGPAVVPQPRP